MANALSDTDSGETVASKDKIIPITGVSAIVKKSRGVNNAHCCVIQQHLLLCVCELSRFIRRASIVSLAACAFSYHHIFEKKNRYLVDHPMKIGKGGQYFSPSFVSDD